MKVLALFSNLNEMEFSFFQTWTKRKHGAQIRTQMKGPQQHKTKVFRTTDISICASRKDNCSWVIVVTIQHMIQMDHLQLTKRTTRPAADVSGNRRLFWGQRVICLLVFGAQVCGLCYIQKKMRILSPAGYHNCRWVTLTQPMNFRARRYCFYKKAFLPIFFDQGKLRGTRTFK